MNPLRIFLIKWLVGKRTVVMNATIELASPIYIATNESIICGNTVKVKKSKKNSGAWLNWVERKNTGMN